MDREILELVYDLVEQECIIDERGTLSSHHIGVYARALRLLAKHGLVVVSIDNDRTVMATKRKEFRHE